MKPAPSRSQKPSTPNMNTMNTFEHEIARLERELSSLRAAASRIVVANAAGKLPVGHAGQGLIDGLAESIARTYHSNQQQPHCSQ
jgi:hypothetical protein